MHSLSFIGSHLLALAFPVSLYSCILYIIGYDRKETSLVISAQRATYLSFALISGAVLVLVGAFLSNDYSILYVFSYSSKSLPFFYKLTGLWAGLDGSMLFWTWLMSMFAAIVLKQNKIKNADWMPYINAVMMVVILFFLALMLYTNNPFTPLGREVLDGKGLNPLLQNVAMVVHPPALYLGFTGLSVPFAFVIAALITRRFDASWIEDTRRWTLIAWLFLALGLILGGAWAYVELGWGGFWAWDPVENAALLPWLTCTAYLHSVMIQKKRGMLVLWNVVLVSLTFVLTIFGTYLTRSGVVQSVHAFSGSTLGPYFLLFIGATIVFTIYLIMSRYDLLKGKNTIVSYLSKESSFLLNNVLFVAATFAVIWGTMFPTMSELFTGQRITVGVPFFNQVMTPIAIVILFLMGVGPMISWKRASVKNLERNLLWPLVAGVVGGLTFYLAGYREWYVVALIATMIFVLGTLFLEFYRGMRVVRIQKKLSFFHCLLDLLIHSNRRYGGYIIHLGVLLMFVGIVGTVYQDAAEFTLMPGSSYNFQDYRFEYVSPIINEDEHKTELRATVNVYQANKKLDVLTPAKFFYQSTEQPSTEVDLYQTALKDVYLIIGNLDPQSGRADFKVTINPLISYVWLGSFVILLGIVIVLLPRTMRLKPSKMMLWIPFLIFTLAGNPYQGFALDKNVNESVAAMSDAEHDHKVDPFLNMDSASPQIQQLKRVSANLICQCPGCVRMTLRNCNCGFAIDEREVLKGMISKNMSDEEIIQAFVDKYGLQVLTVPPHTGFFNLGYWIPMVALVLSLIIGGVIIRRRFYAQRESGADSTDELRKQKPDSKYSKELLKELEEFDS